MDNTLIGAHFSECRQYRYALWRIWDKQKPAVMFIGLNPSTANELTDDPTIRRVKSLAMNWGFGGVYMTNLFAFVSAYPEDLLKCADAINDNDQWLINISALSSEVIFAWGNFKEAQERAKQVIAMFPNAKALHINKNGSPKHPLYVKGDTVPVLFNQQSLTREHKEGGGK
jgi:hypothetical protein